MRGTLLLLTTAILSVAGFTSCVNTKEPERVAVPPKSPNSNLPWNSHGPMAGQGQMGLLPQNQYRR